MKPPLPLPLTIRECSWDVPARRSSKRSGRSPRPRRCGVVFVGNPAGHPKHGTRIIVLRLVKKISTLPWCFTAHDLSTATEGSNEKEVQRSAWQQQTEGFLPSAWMRWYSYPHLRLQSVLSTGRDITESYRQAPARQKARTARLVRSSS